jgi:hypothetical protein
MEYKILSDTTKEGLESQVIEHISDNWIPQGGISTVQTGLGTEFYQALVRIV